MPPTTATIPTTNKMIMPMEIALYVLGPNHGLMSSMCATVCVCVHVCACVYMCVCGVCREKRSQSRGISNLNNQK